MSDLNIDKVAQATPRVDKEARKIADGIAYARGEYVGAEFARQLERELAAAEQDALRWRQHQLERAGILPSSDRALQIHARDCPTAWAFFNKHGLGSKLCPSCLLCGKVEEDRDRWAIRHSELPDIYICKGCVDTARSSPSASSAIPEGYKLLKDSSFDERSWKEDESHENGRYYCTCCVCERQFFGHKRRVLCKVCDADKRSPYVGKQL